MGQLATANGDRLLDWIATGKPTFIHRRGACARLSAMSPVTLR